MKEQQAYDIPLRGAFYILYNAAKKDIKDPELFAGFEKQLPYCSNKQVIRKWPSQVLAREIFGGLYAYYKCSCGSLEMLSKLEDALALNAAFVRNR